MPSRQCGKHGPNTSAVKDHKHQGNSKTREENGPHANVPWNVPPHSEIGLWPWSGCGSGPLQRPHLTGAMTFLQVLQMQQMVSGVTRKARKTLHAQQRKGRTFVAGATIASSLGCVISTPLTSGVRGSLRPTALHTVGSSYQMSSEDQMLLQTLLSISSTQDGTQVRTSGKRQLRNCDLGSGKTREVTQAKCCHLGGVNRLPITVAL